MNKVSLLDCTLRDGGYVNNWNFGRKAIGDILDKLVISNIDYIECGYLSQEKGGDPDKTQFSSIDALSKILPSKHATQQFAVMINFGEYDLAALPDAVENSPILRVCFHKPDKSAAIDYCKGLIDKGYRVFIQPMATLNYSDIDFIQLINDINNIHPYGMYIVDSFGVIELQDFKRLIFIAENNLDMDIVLGYHSHNNLQQAYGNAKFFIEQNLQHKLLLDASIYGMGRGAGNLNMELFSAYLNKYFGKKYNIDPLLDVMDIYLKPIFTQHFWGYSLPFYLSAQYNCHPNYAKYFSDKNTLNNKSMRQLLASIPSNLKDSYSPEIAEQYYNEFQKKHVDDTEAIRVLKSQLEGRSILILDPGKSLKRDEAAISEYISKRDPIIIAVNLLPASFKCDYILCTNEKRLTTLNNAKNCSVIASSNMMDKIHSDYVINYSSYIMPGGSVIADNPTIMLFNLLISLGIQEVTIAGFDGYSVNPAENYFDDTLSMGTSIDIKLEKNHLMRDAVAGLRDNISINFLTDSIYQ